VRRFAQDLFPVCSPPVCGAKSRKRRNPACRARFRTVGAVGFEPTTFRPPAECATRLRHAPVGTSLRERSVRPGWEHMFVARAQQTPLRRCGRCGESKPVAEFAWRRRGRGQRDNMCRPCRSAYGKEHYEANRQRYIDQAAKLKRKVMRERTLFLIEYFKTHPCVDCGETDAVVLEFDHLRDKLFDVGRAVRDRGWQSLLNEMEKCEVVCANCHRRRTARRRGALRALLTAVGPETD
jgi:hypothetical protein